MPKITVYIVTKNRIEQLKAAINSVEGQSYRDFEIIVIDDGSTDATADFLHRYQSTTAFRWARNEISLGAPIARNKAIEMAAGEFITGLDDDDRFHPDRLAQFIHHWSSEAQILTSDDVFVRTNGSRVRWRKKEIITLNDILFKNHIGNQVFTRTEYLLQLGGFDPSLTSAQDYDLWIRLIAAHGPARSIGLPLHDISIANGGERISNDTRRWIGYFNCYTKHKSQMDFEHRKFQLHTIRQAQSKQMISDVFFWVPTRFWLKEIAKHIHKT